MNKYILICSFLLLLLTSCSKSLDNEVDIYSNDFESGNLTNVTNGSISSFASTKVLGRFSNSGFDLTLNDLPSHDLVDISFDLFIHDGWIGNQKFSSNEDTPDIWQLKMNGKTYISTTFSNQACLAGNICPPQSYPADYPNNNYNPRSGAARNDLPGFCSQITNPNGTSMYKIHKSISHSDKTLFIQCLDQFIQKNVTDLKCNASWSVDNIQIKVINLH